MNSILNITDKIKEVKSSLQFLPKSLEYLKNEEYIFFNSKKLKSAYCIDIIHNLLLRYYFRKENKFSLSSVVLKDKYGYIYNYYMDYLKFKGCIILEQDYMVGKNARVYKLNDNIINETIHRYNNKDASLLKKFKNAASLIDEKDIITNSILPEIKKKIVSDLFSVKIDLEKSIFYLEHIKQDNDSYNKNKYSVESIYNKHIFYHFDKYGRVHTNFTILKTFIRKNCLTIDGEETYELDIKNSQPLFLSKIIYEEGNSIDKEEFKIYCNLVKSGNFYQFIMDNSDINDKKNIKELIYKVFFGRNKDSDNIFSMLFPSIYNFIVNYKNDYNSHKVLSHRLQNEESNFIFNKLIKNISIINSDIKIITIHDSIIFPIKYKQIVENTFDSLLEQEFDFIK